MYELFQRPNQLNRYSRDNLYENQQIRLLEDQFTKWVDYLSISDRSFVGNALVYKLIASLVHIPYTDLESYCLDISTASYNLLGTMRITHASQRGNLFSKTVYQTAGIHTLVINDEQEFDLKDFDTQWSTLEAIKIVHHPFTNLGAVDLSHLKSEVSGFCVIYLNISLLMCQYQYYLLQQREVSSIPSFINKVVLPNCLKSHIAGVVLNRYKALYLNLEMEPYSTNNAVITRNLTKEIDIFIVRNLEYYKHHHLSFKEILETIYLPFYGDAKTYLTRPTGYISNIMEFGLYLTYIDTVYFLLKLNHDSHNNRNTQETNYIKRCLIEAHSNKMLSQGLPEELRSYFESYVAKIKPLVQMG